jgi:hypothetical protein
MQAYTDSGVIGYPSADTAEKGLNDTPVVLISNFIDSVLPGAESAR